MKYTSTRDATKFYTFEEALFSGYAPDGGLFVPTELPVFFGCSTTKAAVLSEEWSRLGYSELATEILHPFIEGISKSQLQVLMTKALDGFDDSDVVPIVPLVQKNDTGDKSVDCYVAELFHGPTYCFKVSKRHTMMGFQQQLQ